MKNITTIFFLALTFQITSLLSQPLVTCGENGINALSAMHLKGKVKLLTQTQFKAIDNAGVIEKGEKIDNREQRSINSNFYTTFDQTGKAMKEFMYDDPGKETVYKYSYDSIKHTEIVEQGSEKKCSFRILYKYDATWKLTEEVSYQLLKDDMTLTNKKAFKYNDKGQIVESLLVLDIFDNSHWRSSYKYDNKGNQISSESYNEDRLSSKEILKYDEKGNIIEHDYYNEDCKSIEHKFILQYDAHNNIIEKDFYKPENKFAKRSTYTYEYDKTGNWIKETIYENGKATVILEREFEYY